jgi:hypothetical protein
MVTAARTAVGTTASPREQRGTACCFPMIDDEKETAGAWPGVVEIVALMPATLNQDTDAALDRVRIAA